MTETNLDVLTKFHEAKFEFSNRDAERRLDFADSYAHGALKSLFLVNGASIISLLTLIGNSKLDFDTRGIFWAFSWFSLGIAAALISYFCAYFCQNFYMLVSVTNAWKAKCQALGIENQQDVGKYTKFGHICIGGAIAAAVLSFLLFLTGTFVALVAIT
jgi:hypothetical protein